MVEKAVSRDFSKLHDTLVSWGVADKYISFMKKKKNIPKALPPIPSEQSAPEEIEKKKLRSTFDMYIPPPFD